MSYLLKLAYENIKQANKLEDPAVLQALINNAMKAPSLGQTLGTGAGRGAALGGIMGAATGGVAHMLHKPEEEESAGDKLLRYLRGIGVGGALGAGVGGAAGAGGAGIGYALSR